MRRLLLIIGVLIALAAVPLVALAQSSGDQEKSFFLKFVQDRLSTPDRQISISNIDGALSSDASIREITVADKQGVYLKIDGISLNWNQAALLTGRLDVSSLTAQSIDYLRNPVASPQSAKLPSPEAGGISIPQLPVAVIIKKLSVPKVSFGTAVFGLGSTISVDGALTLDGGSLDSTLAIRRLDGPGGSLGLTAKYDKASTKLDLALQLKEARNGIIANLLNIDGRPDVALNISGSGPISDLKTSLDFSAGGTTALSGTATVKQQAGGFAIDAALAGPIANLIAPPYRPFFGSSTRLDAKALLRNGGGITVQGLTLNGGQLALNGTASTSADWFIDAAHIEGKIGDPNGGSVLLPAAGGATRIGNATLSLDFGGNSQNWRGALSVNDFSNGELSANTFNLTGSGVAVNLDDPAKRRLTFNVDGGLDGITAQNPDVADALGNSLGLGAAGLWDAGQPLQLAQFRLAGKGTELDAAGTVAGGVFDGNVAATVANLTPFSGLAGRALAGAIDLKAKGTISPLSGGFDLDVDGTGTNLAFDEPVADRLLNGTVRLTGGIARTDKGIAARQFRLADAQVQTMADGQFSSDAANFRFTLALADLKLVSPQASGALSVDGIAAGSGGKIALKLTANVPQGKLLDRPLLQAVTGFSGQLDNGALAGTLNGTATLSGQPVSLAAKVSSSDGLYALTGVNFTAGGTTLTGEVKQAEAGLYSGQLGIAAPDVSTAAALLLNQATGAVNGNLTLTPQGGKQGLSLTANVRNLKAQGAAIGTADINARIADLFGVPVIAGTINGGNIAAAGLDITQISAEANKTGPGTAFSGTARLATGTALDVAGSLTPLSPGYRLALDRLNLTQGKLAARLAAPTAIAVKGDDIQLGNLRFAVGGGTITASGSAGSALDIAVAVKALPLDVANAVVPSLGLAGTVDGSARITGSRSAPQAKFDIAATGISAAAIRDFGITPLTLRANGGFSGNKVQFASLAAQSPGGLRLSAKGTVSLDLAGLDLDVSGTAPLALANRFVAYRGAQASGTASVTAHIAGSARSPRVSGKVAVSGGSYVDPSLNLKLVNIAGGASLAGDRLTIDRLAANVATGGSLSASGSISLRAPAFTSDLKLTLTHARYVDQTLVAATASGTLTITGPLVSAPLLAGSITIEKADITVPDKFGGGAAALKVKHIDAPASVKATLKRAQIDSSGKTTTHASSASGPRVDLRISAPNQLFIRGRGLDVEMGGALRLTGRLDDVQPVGAFNLVRGRLSILGQQLTFSTGTITLTGSLDPEIDLVASVPGDDITVTVSVTGRVSDPSIVFSSSPTLPQDEVLSRLLFKQGVTQLSPLQLAKLAAAASQLAGGGGSSLLDSLRNSTGLDDLNLVTDAEGNTALEAGRYLTDKIYLGVQAGADGQSKATINLDVTPHLKANASSGSDGNSSVGLFYEQDY